MDGPYRTQEDDGDGNRLLVDAYFSLRCAAKAMSHVSALDIRWSDNCSLIESATSFCLDANAKLVAAANRLACPVPEAPLPAPARSHSTARGHGRGTGRDWLASLATGYRLRRTLRDIERVLDRTSAGGSAQALRDLPEPP